MRFAVLMVLSVGCAKPRLRTAPPIQTDWMTCLPVRDYFQAPPGISDLRRRYMRGKVSSTAGDALFGVVVTILYLGHVVEQTSSDVSGRYRTTLEPGQYTFSFSYSGAPVLEKTVTVFDDKNQPLDDFVTIDHLTKPRRCI